MPEQGMIFILLIVFAYLSGSVPWGLLLVRRFHGRDVRREGSGNIGATNVRRTAGTSLGLATLALDMAKGAVPTLLAGIFLAGSPGLVAVVALAAFLGHLYPLFLKGRGGKGVATAAGCFLAIAPYACLAAVALFAGIFLMARRVSFASLGAAISLPLLVWLTGGAKPHIALALAIALLIVLRHRENIRRLMAGTEPAMRLRDSGNR